MSRLVTLTFPVRFSFFFFQGGFFSHPAARLLRFNPPPPFFLISRSGSSTVLVASRPSARTYEHPAARARLFWIFF